MPRAPTHAPTGSTLPSFDATAIFVRWPGSRATARSLDDAVDELRHFEFEQPPHEARVRARHHDLRAFRGLADLDDVRLHPGAVVVVVARDLLGLREQRFDPAEVEQRVARVGLLDDAGDDVAFAARVLLVLHLAFGFADALQDHLLRGLRGDAPEVFGRVVPLADDVAVFVEFLRDHVDVAGLDVDLDERFFGGVRACACTR